jgi:hypothetical protein
MGDMQNSKYLHMILEVHGFSPYVSEQSCSLSGQYVGKGDRVAESVRWRPSLPRRPLHTQ